MAMPPASGIPKNTNGIVSGNSHEFPLINAFHSYRATSCIRCLHLKLRSANVLQVFALNQEIISKCYTTEELAEKNCPSEESLANREAAEILLFSELTIDDYHIYITRALL